MLADCCLRSLTSAALAVAVTVHLTTASYPAPPQLWVRGDERVPGAHALHPTGRVHRRCGPVRAGSCRLQAPAERAAAPAWCACCSDAQRPSLWYWFRTAHCCSCPHAQHCFPPHTCLCREATQQEIHTYVHRMRVGCALAVCKCLAGRAIHCNAFRRCACAIPHVNRGVQCSAAVHQTGCACAFHFHPCRRRAGMWTRPLRSC